MNTLPAPKRVQAYNASIPLVTIAEIPQLVALMDESRPWQMSEFWQLRPAEQTLT